MVLKPQCGKLKRLFQFKGLVMQAGLNGRIVYLAGPSGCGKDSLIQYIRHRCDADPLVQVAHRYITRDAKAGGENHIELSTIEFESRDAAGLFAMSWESHGLHYGIGNEINQWLCKGITVVINGSRSYLPRALVKYPELIPVFIEASPEVLAQRLHNRARETQAETAARLNRGQTTWSRPANAIVIDNNGKLETAGNLLLSVIGNASSLVPVKNKLAHSL